MNKYLNILVILLAFSNFSIAQVIPLKNTDSSKELIEYSNKKFKFKVSIPSEWHLHNEKRKGRKKLTIEWLLPKVYDSIHNEYVSSTIYIKAFRNNSIKNTSYMILSAYLSIAGKSIDLAVEPNNASDSRILYMDASNGDKYKGKIYFKFNNGIGYRITYQTSQGTYENDLQVFENFISSFEYK